MASSSAPRGDGSGNNGEVSRAGITQPLLSSDDDNVPEPDPHWSLRRIDKRQRRYELEIRTLQARLREVESQALRLRTAVGKLEASTEAMRGLVERLKERSEEDGGTTAAGGEREGAS